MNNRLELCSVFEEHRKTNLGVELGCFEGNFSKEILKRWEGNLFLVDVWKDLPIEDYKDYSNQNDYKKIICKCIDNIKGSEGRCFMLRMDGRKAFNFFSDESLDFVYIDANHKYEAVVEDIKNWFPKVRKGGVVSGHDYLPMDWYNDSNFCKNGKDKPIYVQDLQDPSKYNYLGEFGVNVAVDEFCSENNYEVTTTSSDWFGSWMFIK